MFVIPSSVELDLKKAAQAVGDKYVEMLKSRELEPRTGYVHGGCSPIRLYRHFPLTLIKGTITSSMLMPPLVMAASPNLSKDTPLLQIK